MDRTQIIELFLELMNFPKVMELMELELRRLELTLGEQLSDYRRLRESFKKAVFRQLLVHEGGSPPDEPMYWFEISRTGKDRWEVTDIEPPLPEGVDMGYVVPAGFIDMVAGFETSEEEIREHQGEFDTPSGRQEFQVRFAKYTDDNAMGTIREVDSTDSTEPASARKLEVIHTGTDYSQSDDEKNFGQLFYYMKKYPDLKKYILDEFFTVLKPLFDRKNSMDTLS